MTAEITEMGDRAVSLSIARLAEAFGMARETVSRKLAVAKVQPDGNRRGYPVYRLRDACPALLANYAADGSLIDPATMRPESRRAWFQSENERLKFEQETGQLILATEVHSEMANIAKIVVRFLEILPDNVERDLRCGPEVVEYLIRKTREVRQQVADALRNDDVEPESKVGT